MKPLLQHAQRSFIANARFVVPKQSTQFFSKHMLGSLSSTPSVCLQCQHRASLAFGSNRNPQWPAQLPKRRRLHQPSHEEEERPKDGKDTLLEGKPEEKPLADAIEPSSSDTDTIPPPVKGDVGEQAQKDQVKKQTVENKGIKHDIERVPAHQLPSHREAQRWDFSKRFQEHMDDLLPKLAVVTQRVNTLTGTDYSGIEALKREIKEHETLVKTRRAAIEEAKHALDAAHAQQASSQKEVVALLERKHSWSATDLERYMSLIRSEHVNDQAVREAKENITLAESALEEARAQLERRERAQYHEEQIWSDTIRRNSTWVTFGLMGLNIFLLLATMVVIEPWRRRKMVREIKKAMEAQKPVVEPAPAAQAVAAAPVAATPAVAAEVEKETEPAETVPPVPVTADLIASASPIQQDTDFVAETASEMPSVLPDSPVQPTEESPVDPVTASVTDKEKVVPLESINIEEEVRSSTTWEAWREKVTYIAKDIISERTISMRRVDYTAAILNGAAAGAMITAAIVAMIIRR